MFNKSSYIERRGRLRDKLSSLGGIIIIPSNIDAPYNYPNNIYPFRQDSTFRYLFEANTPSLIGVLDLDSGEDLLFGDDPTIDDQIWTGDLPTIKSLSEICGVQNTRNRSQLEEYILKVIKSGRKIHILPPYRGEVKIELARLLGCSIAELQNFVSAELMFAIAELREVKSLKEIEEMEKIYEVGYEMHTTAMRMTRPGVSEREIAGQLDGIARQRGAGVSFPTIFSQHGEILHNISQDGVLEVGRLVLCDAGAESLSGYCSDHTRTYPVSGKFSTLQRDIYNIVLAAHNRVRECAHAGMLYNELHTTAYKTLAKGLCDFGLLKGSIDEIMESGAVRLFMPHGTGHGLGMDVHDCEAYSERSFDYTPYIEHAKRSGTTIHRASWILREGCIITNEPGLYFIPALIEKSRKEGLYKGIIDYTLAEKFYNFGGIRIEDDLVITGSGCRQIGEQNPIPKSVVEIEEFMKEQL